MSAENSTALRVLRLCSVFEPPATAVSGRGVKFDPIGGMQNHTTELTRALDQRGVLQTVLTTRPPTAPLSERLGDHTHVIRPGLPFKQFRQLYGPHVALLAPLLAGQADVVHVHLGRSTVWSTARIWPTVWPSRRASRRRTMTGRC